MSLKLGFMVDIYAKTARQIPEMRQEARDRKLGQATLALGVTHEADGAYHYEPPWKPLGLP